MHVFPSETKTAAAKIGRSNRPYGLLFQAAQIGRQISHIAGRHLAQQ